MPRQLRIQYEGAIYHLMNRGDRREEISRDDLDRKRFLQTLGTVGVRKGKGVHPDSLSSELMARPLRIQYAGARYHLMSRGDRRELIFLDEKDRELSFRLA